MAASAASGGALFKEVSLYELGYFGFLLGSPALAPLTLLPLSSSRISLVGTFEFFPHSLPDTTYSIPAFSTCSLRNTLYFEAPAFLYFFCNILNFFRVVALECLIEVLFVVLIFSFYPLCTALGVSRLFLLDFSNIALGVSRLSLPDGVPYNLVDISTTFRGLLSSTLDKVSADLSGLLHILIVYIPALSLSACFAARARSAPLPLSTLLTA